MSKLEDLIQKLCPNGVEWKELGELGFLFSGLNGKSKKDFENGNQRFITYMNVFSNLELDIDINDKVLILDNEKQNTLLYGDIIFTASSETREECGISSVMTKKTNDKLFLNSFCFGFRFNDVNIMLPGFSKYLFRANFIRKQIVRTASGVTRFNISKEKMKQIKIPIPPLEIQEEIVHILDSFTELTNELTNELTARRKQYEHYRDSLLTFGNEVEWKELEEFATVIRGGNFQKKDFKTEGVPCIHYGQIYTKYGLKTDKTITFLDEKIASKSKMAKKNDIIMAVTSENIEDVCKCLSWLGDKDVAISGHTAIIKHNQNSLYLSYYFHTEMFYKQKLKLAHGTKVIEVTPSSLLNIKIPLPPLPEQERIVSILDKFDSLCNDITKGLPAEIEARKKQYEYYRDKLLTFKNISENK